MARAIAILIAILLAGCSNPDPEPAPTPTPTAQATPTPAPTTTPPVATPASTIPMLLDFGLHNCTGIQVLQATAAATAQALLPANYTAAIGTAGTATLAAEIYRCERFTTRGVLLDESFVGQIYVPIEPPYGLFADANDTDVHQYTLRMLSGENVLALVWAAAGFNTYNGTTNLTFSQPAGLLPTQASAFVGVYEWTMAGSASDSTQEASFARYHVRSDGSTLRWQGNFTLTTAASGFGTVAIAGDDPAAGHGMVQPNSLDGAAAVLQGSFEGQALHQHLSL